MEPLFSLETSLGIGILLAALAVLAFLVVLFGGQCRHAWMLRYDANTHHVYGECRHCQATTPGWVYGQRHHRSGKDAA
jgi:hypothetical protein